ncbi:MAG: hypothetical protein ACK2U9_19175, partial [Anaerolineae bacterium]
MNRSDVKLRNWLRTLPGYLVMLGAMAVALFPIVLIVMNSFKDRKAIFSMPWMPGSLTAGILLSA